MLTFSRLIEGLNIQPVSILPGKEGPITRVSTAIDAVRRPETLLILSGQETDRVETACAGIISRRPVQADCPVAIYEDGTDFDRLCEACEDAVLDELRLQDGKGRLLEAFLNQGSVQDLVDITYELLGLPVTIFDLSTKVAAFAGAEQIRQSNFPEALYVLGRGFAAGCTPEYRFNKMTKMYADIVEPTITTYGREIPRLCCRLMVMNEFAGHVNIMGLGREFRNSDIELEKILRDLIEKIWEKRNSYLYNPAAALLCDVYEGGFSGSQAELEERMKLLDFSIAPYWCTLYVCLSGNNGQHPPLKSLITQFVVHNAGQWKNKITFFVRTDGAYCLIALGNYREAEALGETVKLFLDKNDCRGGLSKPFCNLKDFRVYCDQSRCLAEEALKDNRVILNTFHMAYWDEVVRCLKQVTDLNVFLCNEVRLLAEYDKENDSQLVKTLCVYLECGRNSSEAAKRMYVHRNTMIRRLERISQLIGRSLETIVDSGQIALSAKILKQL